MKIGLDAIRKGPFIRWGKAQDGGCWGNGFVVLKEQHLESVFTLEAFEYMKGMAPGFYDDAKSLGPPLGVGRLLPFEPYRRLCYEEVPGLSGKRVYVGLEGRMCGLVLRQADPRDYQGPVVVNAAFAGALALGDFFYQTQDPAGPIAICRSDNYLSGKVIYRKEIEAIVWPLILT